jgi:carboxyl-terminal processing protease
MLPSVAPLAERSGIHAPAHVLLRAFVLAAMLLAAVAPDGAARAQTETQTRQREPPEEAPLQQEVVTLPAAEGTAGSPLESGLKTIEQHFITPISRDQLETESLAALLEELDPYSHYFAPAEMDAFRAQLDASFTGIGVSLGYDDASGYPNVAYLLRGGVAGSAGVQRGDLLLEIDGHDLKGKGWEFVSTRLRGRAGTPVALKLRREGVPEPIALTLTRIAIDNPSVRALHRDAAGVPDWWLDRDRRLGYLRVASIVADTAPGVDAALAELQRGGARGLVLDLRDCTGGLIRGALETADLFVDRGQLLTIRQRGEDKTYKAKRGKYTKLPMAILINGRTISSCEILAGALADNGRGTLVGERSYGKGRIQVIYTLGEGRGGMVMSTGTFQRPNGKTIDKHDVPEGSTDVGIAPQVEVKMSEAEHKAWLAFAELTTGTYVLTPEEQQGAPPDPVLAKAIELLGEK